MRSAVRRDVGVTRSSEVLERLERRNLLVVPLDRRREWYRYHHLFRELLLSELRRREPEMVAELHLRAAAWCEANGMPEAAIEHAQAAGDADRVAGLVLQLANPVWASGRFDTVLRWMEWFEANGLIERYPAIAVHGALMYALVGRAGRHRALGGRGGADAADRGRSPTATRWRRTLAYLRALLCRDGPDQMRHDARTSWQGLSPASPYRATMLHAEGLSHLLEGDTDAGRRHLRPRRRRRDARRHPALRPGPPRRARHRWRSSAATGQRPSAFAEQALALMEGGQFDDYWTSALVFAWAARVALQRGDLEQGRQLVARAARLRPLLNYALPVVSAQALLEMARAYIALADPGGARAVLRQASDIFQQRPDLGNLPEHGRRAAGEGRHGPTLERSERRR